MMSATYTQCTHLCCCCRSRVSFAPIFKVSDESLFTKASLAATAGLTHGAFYREDTCQAGSPFELRTCSQLICLVQLPCLGGCVSHPGEISSCRSAVLLVSLRLHCHLVAGSFLLIDTSINKPVAAHFLTRLLLTSARTACTANSHEHTAEKGPEALPEVWNVFVTVWTDRESMQSMYGRDGAGWACHSGWSGVDEQSPAPPD